MEDVDQLAATFESADAATIALEDGGTFKVQKALLCNAADYFKKALEGGFAEAGTQTLKLPGCTTAALKLFLYWLCNRRLPNVPLGEQQDFEIGLASLWAFANYIGIPKLQNEALGRLDKAIGDNPPLIALIKAIFSEVGDRSGLSAYIVCKTIGAWRDDSRDRAAYTDEDMEELGAIPGFFRHFTEVIKDCASGCSHEDHYNPAIVPGDIEEHFWVEQNAEE